MYEAKVIADSLNDKGHRLTSFQVTYPHAVHKDIMTHCAFARNFQSFRAYPPEKVIANIKADPFIPEVFGKRVKGMGQRNEPLNDPEAIDQNFARDLWMTQVTRAVEMAQRFLKMDVAKQQVNFLLQDFTWITGIITATEWDNFWALRADPTDPNALPRPEVQKIAKMMKEVYLDSEPVELWSEGGQFSAHLPLVDEREDGKVLYNDYGVHDEWAIQKLLKKVSVGRCARVSYLTHEGIRDLNADIKLSDQLSSNGHLSPFDHVAKPFTRGEWETVRELQIEATKELHLSKERRDMFCEMLEFAGKYRGFMPLRKEIPHESNYAAYLASLARTQVSDTPDISSDPNPEGELLSVLGTLSTISPRD